MSRRRTVLRALAGFAAVAVCGLAGLVAVPVVIVCMLGDAIGDRNVNAPRGDAVGADRHADFMRVVEHAKTLPVGHHSSSELPDSLRLKNLLCVHVVSKTVVALEFPSHPIDSNPIYMYVDPSEDIPGRTVEFACRDHSCWTFDRKLKEEGWYYVHGP